MTKSLKDDFFGSFQYDDILENWFTEFHDGQSKVWVTIGDEKDLNTAKEIYQNLTYWDKEAKKLAVPVILEESEKGMDRVPSAEEAIKTIFLESISLYSDDEDTYITFSYDDGLLLGGHIIVVDGTLSQGFDSAYIEG